MINGADVIATDHALQLPYLGAVDVFVRPLALLAEWMRPVDACGHHANVGSDHLLGSVALSER